MRYSFSNTSLIGRMVVPTGGKEIEMERGECARRGGVVCLLCVKRYHFSKYTIESFCHYNTDNKSLDNMTLDSASLASCYMAVVLVRV